MVPPLSPNFRELAEWLAAVAGILTTLGLRHWLGRQLRALFHFLRRRMSRALHPDLYASLAEQRAAHERLAAQLEETGALLRAHNATMQALTGRIYEEVQAVKKTSEELRSQWSPNGGSSPLDLLYLLAARQGAQDNDDDRPSWETDAQGRCKWVNAAYVRHTGRLPDEVTGSGWINAVHPEDRDWVREEYAAAVAEDRDFEATYRLWDHRSGTAYTVAAHDYRLRAPDGRTIGRRGRARVLAA